MDEEVERDRVVAEARSWLLTPWRHMADKKGEAVDCAMLLVRCFCDTGVLPPFDPRPYPRAWFLHQDEERFLAWVTERLRAVEVDLSAARPGDVLVYRFGRCYSHGGVLVAPQVIIHAFAKCGRCVLTETFDVDLSTRAPRAFNLWAGRR